MVELSEFIGNFFLELIGLITFYQRSPMDFFYFLIRASVQLHFTIYQNKILSIFLKLKLTLFFIKITFLFRYL